MRLDPARSRSLDQHRQLRLRRLGPLHNDLQPIEGIADWSFAPGVDAATAGRYVEVDLYVPEYAAADPLSRGQPWFPLVAVARKDAVLVYARGPRSYVVILPAEGEP
jgi:hypothetical protein